MKNIIFDLGGVLFARDKNKSTQAFTDFFDFIRTDPMPEFWVEYDRGTLTMNQVADILCEVNHCTRETCDAYLSEAIERQEPIKPTEQLIGELKAAGYKLYVLSNMSREFIANLRRHAVYRHFDGEVVSCEEGTVKPEPRIYEILLDRYGLIPSETLFVDDRRANLATAESLGIHTHLFDHHHAAETCAELRTRLLK